MTAGSTERTSPEVAAHLQRRYGIRVTGLTELDLGVVRVDREDGPSWVARVFPADRPLQAVEGDAEILRLLEADGFPAERCAVADPVSAHGGRGVLVTGFVPGQPARGSDDLFHSLGDLLGRLHARPPGPGAASRDGGAWHHLAPTGGPRDEIDAALALLAESAHRVPPGQEGLHETLHDAVADLEDGHDLPVALTHPDFVPLNVVVGTDGEPVVVDWAGAGRGPRLSTLGFLLWAAGAAGGIRGRTRVDAVVAGYRTHIRPERAELARLAGAVGARPVILGAWACCRGRTELTDVVRDLEPTRALAGAIAARAAAAFADPTGRPRGAPLPRNDPADRTAQGGQGAGVEQGEGVEQGARVGGTGLAVAAIRAEETARPDRLFADPLAEAFAAESVWSPAQLPERRAAALRVWIVARTVFLDEAVAAACEDGCRQIVLLGAGFDARAFRLPWPPGVRCFEVDTADVLDHKDRVLAARAARARCERIPVAADLREDWPGALLAAGFRPAQPTAWIAEGLLVYLSAAEADGVLADLTAESAPGSRLGLTLATRDPAAEDGEPSPFTALRRSRGPDDPVRWLAGHGWTATVSDPVEVLRAHGRPVRGRSETTGPPATRRPRALLLSATRRDAAGEQRP